MALIDPDKDDCILDLFCGLGNFHIADCTFQARRYWALKVISIWSGRQSKMRNRMTSVTQIFIVGDLYGDQTDRLTEARGFNARKFNKILLDPPRSGALTVVTELVPKLLPEKIIYVSCNPATLARDANELVNNNNYALTCAGAIGHVPRILPMFESIALFEKVYTV